uniref:Uncharacterized protein n=1 Tax=Anguilla anguilla TaxID=7936 RepID=A0A0E9W4P3_ANGAN
MQSTVGHSALPIQVFASGLLATPTSRPTAKISWPGLNFEQKMSLRFG